MKARPHVNGGALPTRPPSQALSPTGAGPHTPAGQPCHGALWRAGPELLEEMESASCFRGMNEPMSTDGMGGDAGWVRFCQEGLGVRGTQGTRMNRRLEWLWEEPLFPADLLPLSPAPETRPRKPRGPSDGPSPTHVRAQTHIYLWAL